MIYYLKIFSSLPRNGKNKKNFLDESKQMRMIKASVCMLLQNFSLIADSFIVSDSLPSLKLDWFHLVADLEGRFIIIH